jgi:hypothetical protein
MMWRLITPGIVCASTGKKCKGCEEKKNGRQDFGRFPSAS